MHSTGKVRRRGGTSWTTSSRPTRVFDLSYQFSSCFPRPLVPSRSPSLSLLLSLSLLPADCITLCRRQAVWPVYSSVASSPLSLSLGSPSPSLHSHSFSSRSFFSRAPSPSPRYPRTRVPYLSLRRVCDTCPTCVCDTFLRSDRLLRQPVL